MRRDSGRRLALALALVAATAACATVPEGPIAGAPLTFDTKMMAILQLEDRRILRLPDAELPPPVPPVPGQRTVIAPPPPDLISLLRDDNAQLRRRAALAVGRVGLPEAIGPLTTVLTDDPEPEIRLMAAFAMGLIGDAAAADALLAALEDRDARVEARAAEALGLIGHRAAAPAIAARVRARVDAGAMAGVQPDDLAWPQSPDVEVVRLGAYALVRLGDYDALAGALLDAGGAPVSQWWPVAYAFQRIGDPRAVPVLLDLLGSEGQLTRSFAARGLGAHGDARAVAALVALVGDDRAPQAVRVQAVRSLAALGAAEAGPAVARLLTTRDTASALRLEATVALGRVGGDIAVDLLIDLLTDRAQAIRGAALESLAQLDLDTFLLAVSGLPPDPHFSARAALARALARLPAEFATPRLEVLAADEDQRVVPVALAALVEAGAPGVEARLIEALGADDPVVRQAAAAGLAARKAVAAVGPLQVALDDAAADGTYVARAAILDALARLDPAGAPALLGRVLAEDRDWAVRVRAAALLRERDPGADVSSMRPAPVPAPADMAALAALIRPPYSPQAYIETDKGTIQIDLAVIDAPRTVANFVELVRRGYFNGVALHRVVPDFVVQDGDPRGDGEGNPGYTIRDEINERPYLRGTVGMALDWRDTGGSQFFITHSPQPHLDARYTVFGQVLSGMDVVDALEPWDVIRRIRVWDGVAWIGVP